MGVEVGRCGGAGGGGGDARGGAGGGGAGRAAGRGRDPGGVGAGFAYSTALEALKLKETCYLTAVGLSYADLVHGPIAVADHDTPALLVAAGDGPMLPEMTGLARRIAGTGADVYGIGGDQEFAAACRSHSPRACAARAPGPFALIVPGQLLVEALARPRASTRTPPASTRSPRPTADAASAGAARTRLDSLMYCWSSMKARRQRKYSERGRSSVISGPEPMKERSWSSASHWERRTTSTQPSASVTGMVGDVVQVAQGGGRAEDLADVGPR